MPDFVTMENVPRVQYSPIFDEFVARLKQAGYDVTYRVLFGPDYGFRSAVGGWCCWPH